MKLTQQNWKGSHQQNWKGSVNRTRRVPVNRTEWFPPTEMEGFRSTELEGFPTSELEGFPLTELEGFTSTELEGFPLSELEGFRSTELELISSTELLNSCEFWAWCVSTTGQGSVFSIQIPNGFTVHIFVCLSLKRKLTLRGRGHRGFKRQLYCCYLFYLSIIMFLICIWKCEVILPHFLMPICPSKGWPISLPFFSLLCSSLTLSPCSVPP